MTLVEIMVVIIIMAMIATAVGIAVIQRMVDARSKQARIDAQTIRGAVTLWLTSHGTHECPTMAQLVEDGVVSSSSNTVDPWGRAFHIECEGLREPVVHSAGADGQLGTDDDIL